MATVNKLHQLLLIHLYRPWWVRIGQRGREEFQILRDGDRLQARWVSTVPIHWNWALLHRLSFRSFTFVSGHLPYIPSCHRGRWRGTHLKKDVQIRPLDGKDEQRSTVVIGNSNMWILCAMVPTIGKNLVVFSIGLWSWWIWQWTPLPGEGFTQRRGSFPSWRFLWLCGLSWSFLFSNWATGGA